ncbi:MAG: hypothetical protein O7G13_10625 [Alphaproteobacteria bacterium]|nr:hypothetical protein [Alphaproteobacteria bacterium]
MLVESLCHRIADNGDLDAFEASIRTVLADPAAARERAARLRERMLTARTPAAYRNASDRAIGKRPIRWRN